MAKNRRRQAAAAPMVSPTTPLFSARGKKLIGAGLFGVLLGFAALTFTDPAGRNAASQLAPALLVIGYALIGFGIVSRSSGSDASPSSSAPSSPK